MKYQENDPSADQTEMCSMTATNADCFFICCLSEKGDLLSQWGAYAENGTGVAIGFDPYQLIIEDNVHWVAKPNEIPDISIYKIEYQACVQENTIRDYIEVWAKGPECESGDTIYNCLNSSLQIQFKKPAFEEEKEYRLVTSPGIHNESEDEYAVPKMEFTGDEPELKLKHYISNGNISAYVDSPFPPLAVRNIILGPKNLFQEFNLITFLDTNNLGHVELLRSSATYL